MKAVGNKMKHVGIIQRILKKLVQLRQKIDIPQLSNSVILTFIFAEQLTPSKHYQQFIYKIFSNR